jgi:hypothetical protein
MVKVGIPATTFIQSNPATDDGTKLLALTHTIASITFVNDHYGLLGMFGIAFKLFRIIVTMKR